MWVIPSPLVRIYPADGDEVKTARTIRAGDASGPGRDISLVADDVLGRKLATGLCIVL